MRDPDNLIQVPLNVDHTIYLNELPEFDIEDYDLFDDKKFKKFMEDLKRMIRKSFEYQTMVQYMRENMDMNQCAFYSNVNNIDTAKIKIHLHHDPLSLHDISLIVFNKRVAYQESLDIELVAKEVMFLHYLLMIGLIPLSETAHQLVHNNYLFVPTTNVLGNYREFVNLYKPFFPPEQLDVLERIENLTLTTTINKEILEKNFVYVDCTGEYKLPLMSDLKDAFSSNTSSDATEIDYYDNNLIIPATIGSKE